MLLTKTAQYAEQAAASAENEFEAGESLPIKLADTKLYTDFRRRSFCFTGGKGGVGKTTLLLRTAAYLRQKNYPVRIIDCDPQPDANFIVTHKLTRTNERNVLPDGAIVYTLLNPTAKYEKSTHDLLDKPFAESRYTYGELNLLTKQAMDKDRNAAQDARLELLINLDRQTQKEITPDSVILYDCAAGVEFSSTLPYFLTTYFFIITNPEKTALEDAAGVIKIIARNEHTAKNIYPVINKTPVTRSKIMLTAMKEASLILSNIRGLFFTEWLAVSGAAVPKPAANFADAIHVMEYPAQINAERLGQKIIELLNPAGAP
ncbi:hypothetical protein NO1_0871 [Candidatus Termititenax aidoneus]|uniref:CobQ/CobB/MinD/ParA nucleotide binding domain-containing protein n=1 Tax=Termititenax aidoneus TaxID=2218524 RepID=A0A388TB40_TERA1|nr:hypothetical protein NO1_0871 [Candidatus Termititenax aidoneus]